MPALLGRDLQQRNSVSWTQLISKLLLHFSPSLLRLVSSFHSQVSGHLSSPVNPSLFLNIKTNPSRAWSFSLSPSLGVDSIKISVSINHSENVYWISRLNSIAGSSARSGLAPLILNILHVMECDSNCH